MTESSPDDDTLQRWLVASRALEEAPEQLVQDAIDLWDKRPRPLAASPARRRLSVGLIFDSLQSSAALAGVRARDDARQLLFSMEGRDVDLRIRRSGSSPAGGWTVSGQVLGPDGQGSTSIRCGGFEATVPWSAMCEFHVEPIPAGECIVSLHAEDWEAVLPAFVLPASS